MKKRERGSLTGFSLFLVLLLLAKLAHGQAVAPSNLQYTWTPVTGTSGAQVGQYLVFSNVNVARPGNYSIDWSVTGTTPATCTFRVEGSADAVNWYGLDVTSPSTTSCTTSNMESITYKPVLYLRINITYTQGDGTTRVNFHYTGGRS